MWTRRSLLIRVGVCVGAGGGGGGGGGVTRGIIDLFESATNFTYIHTHTHTHIALGEQSNRRQARDKRKDGRHGRAARERGFWGVEGHELS